MPNSPNITPKCQNASILAMHIQRLVHLSLMISPLFFLCFFLFPAKIQTEQQKTNIQRLIWWFANHTPKKTTPPKKNNSNISPNPPGPPKTATSPTNQQPEKSPKAQKWWIISRKTTNSPTWIVPLEVIGSMVRTEQWVISPKYTPITKIYSLQISKGKGEKKPLILTSNGTSKFPLHFPPGVFAGLWTGGTRTLLQLTGSNIRCASAPPKATSDGSKSCVSRCATLRPMTENTWS